MKQLKPGVIKLFYSLRDGMECGWVMGQWVSGFDMSGKAEFAHELGHSYFFPDEIRIQYTVSL